MTLKKNKSSERGSYKLAVSLQFGIAAVQWTDSKVVNCISTYMDFREQTIERQIGPSRQEFPCPRMLALYQEAMSGVDRVDQMRAHSGGLASVAHFKKWYKKALFAVIDNMLVNGFHLWNAVAEKSNGRKLKLKRHQYLRIISNMLLRYKTLTGLSPSPVSKRRRTHFESPGTIQNQQCEEVLVDDGKLTAVARPDQKCIVCSIELSQYRSLYAKMEQMSPATFKQKESINKEKVKNVQRGVRERVSTCRVCNVNAHNHQLEERKKKIIHSLFPPNLTCMEILHSPLGRQVWNITDKDGKCNARVRTSHEVITNLREAIAEDLGIPKKVGETANRRRKM
jgi:hypothetical protein